MPNLAVIEELKKHSRIGLLYIGSSEGMDQRLVEKTGVEFRGIEAAKLRRYFSFLNIFEIFRFPFSIRRAYRILKEWQPEAVFVTGGFVSVPVVLAAKKLKVPVIAYEADVVPGAANWMCFGYAAKICLAFEESLEQLKKFGEKAVVTGPAIRTSILSGDKDRGRRFVGFNDYRPIVLVMGGSQGAAQINELIDSSLDELLKKFQIVHVRGRGKLDIGQHKPGYMQYEYLDREMADVYACCDLVVSRAGANSLAEIAAVGKKALIIPLGRHASRGEQIENAKIYAHRYGWGLLEGDIGAEDFVKAVEMAYGNDYRRGATPASGAAKIVDIILQNEK